MPGMPWFKYFPKDIAIATDGMSLEDFAIAVKLMGTYTSSGQPIDGEMAASRFGAKGERVRFVLKALFTEVDADKWIYEPLREQLESYQARSAVNKSNAANTRSPSAKASRANRERIASESLANGEQIVDAPHANGEQITETEVRSKNVEGSGADESSPAPQQAAIDLPEPVQPKVAKKPAAGSAKKVHLADAFSTLPDDWREFCTAARPDLDAEKVFIPFRFYYVSGKGATTVRTVRGWSGAWKNWVLKENATEANRARPRAKTPEEHRAYQRGAAIAYGFPEQYADECVDNRYSTGSQSIEDAVLTTARPQ
jgi:uncharacterized protein YdaU (DUF1376 family)